MEKLIVIPLFIMFFISIFGFFYSNSMVFGTNELNTLGQTDVVNIGGEDCFVDSSGHAVCYVNGTNYDDVGVLVKVDFLGASRNNYRWDNSSGSFFVGTGLPEGVDAGFSMNTVYGVLGVVIALMAISIVISLRLFGTGISDMGIDAFFKSSGYLTLWLIFGLYSLQFMSMIPYFGVVLYFGLTLMYTLGTINSVGHPSGGD